MGMRKEARTELEAGGALSDLGDVDPEVHLARLAEQRTRREEHLSRMQAALVGAGSSEPTFTPTITEYAGSLQREENVFDRLYYTKQLSPSKADVAKAKRTATRTKAQPGTSVVVPAASRPRRAGDGDGGDDGDQAIEVLLYQDAEVRRKKHELLRRERVETENVLRNKSKISKATRELAVASIRKKIEALFKQITQSDRAQLLTRAKLDLALQQLGFFPTNRAADKPTPAAELEIGNRLWTVMDPTDAGRVSLGVFRKTLSYIMDPTYSGGKAEAEADAAAAAADGKAGEAEEDEARVPVPAGLPELRRRLYMMRLVNHGSRRANDELIEEVRRQEMQECTFNPAISKVSRKLDHEATNRRGEHVERSEVLYQRAAKAEQRKERTRLELDHEALKECTFQPKISSTSRRLANRADGDGPGRLEKLSAPRVRVEQPTTEELRAAECTFKPNTVLTASKTARVKAKILEPRNADEQARPSSKKMTAAERKRAMERTVRGADAYIRRMEAAKRAAEEKRLAYERVGRVPKTKDLQRVRKLKPFKFEHDAKVRQAAHASAGCAVDLGPGDDNDAEDAEIRPVAMYMDVNLGAGRSGRLAIHAMDNPHVLAHNFAAIYGLNAEMTQALEAMVLAHMEQMDIAISTSMAGKVRRRLPGSDRAAQMPHLTPEDIEASRRSPSPKRRDMSPFREPAVSVRRPADEAEQRKIRRKKKVRRPAKAPAADEEEEDENQFTYVPHAHAKLDLSVHEFEEPQAPSSRLSPRAEDAAFGSEDDFVEEGPTESWQIRFDAPVQT